MNHELTILVVEPTPADRAVLVEFLRHDAQLESFRIVEASDAKEALKLLSQVQPHVVFTELDLPGMDGILLCHNIRQQPGSENLLLFAMSAVHTHPVLAERLKTSYAASLLVKPIDKAYWGQRIQTAITALPMARVPSLFVPATQQQLPPIDFSKATSGTLQPCVLPNLLIQAAVAQVTGELQLKQGKVQKTVYWVSGKPVYVDSNLRQETLGSYLVAQGQLSEDNLARAIRHARANNKKLGEALRQLDLISEETLDQGLRAQASIKLLSMLRWSDGTFSFTPTKEFISKVPNTTIDLIPLILSALRRLNLSEPDWESLYTSSAQLTPLGLQLSSAIRETYGGQLSDWIGAGQPLQVLLDQTLDRPTMLVQVACLVSADLLAFVAAAHDVASRPPSTASASASHHDLIGLDPKHSSPQLDIAELEFAMPATTIQQTGLFAAMTSEFDPSSVIQLGPPMAAEVMSLPDIDFPSSNSSTELADFRESLPTHTETLEPDNFGAELQFQHGLACLRQKAYSEAIDAFRLAALKHEAQADYHAYLAWSIYLHANKSDHGRAEAQPNILRALMIDPDSVLAHEMAGRLAYDGKQWREATVHLSKALQYGPPRLDLYELLKGAFEQKRDYQELERFTRRLLLRLRDTDPLSTVSLWLNLAQLYRTYLNQPGEAEMALEVAQRLDPKNPAVQAATIALRENLKICWSNEAEEARQRYKANPSDVTPLRDLFVHYSTLGMRPQTWTIAALLVGLNEATADAQNCYESLCTLYAEPLMPAALSTSFREQLVALVRLQTDSEVMSSLIVKLAPLISRMIPISLSKLGIVPADHLPIDKLAPGLQHGLTRIAQCLAMPLPELYRATAHGCFGAEPVPVLRPQLLVQSDLLPHPDNTAGAPDLEFFLAAALFNLADGRKQAYGLLSQDLAQVLSLAMRAISTDSAVEPTEEVRHAQQQVMQCGVGLSELIDIFAELRRNNQQLNLSAWGRAVRRSGYRAAMVLGGNPAVAIGALKQKDPSAARDLVGFALSNAYWLLRA